eukprot:CAMPEP_0176418970 /NCGR_PEP_ID=MMETSP0127-20121128/7781_1 /TAXON_ID=938130 /ORGANISM="Platyophrya macrostoma, Strain WH" /LENGTH=491 /DNA_ID=CAMNT_0017799383 /DNA_START=45 /DNA_END=1520 /DNA_ORIENTATION=+
MVSKDKVKLSKSSFIDMCVNRDIRDDYLIEKQLGSGAYGIVYGGTHKKTGEKRAIKAINKEKVEDKEAFENEISILKSLDHPNILKLFEIYDYKNAIYLVTELCEGGELFYYITKTKYLTEAQAAKIMRQIFSAIAYLHSNRVVHRDLKPENFLLKYENDDSVVKLIDFGLSRKMAENEILTDPNGTPFYIAPEILEGNYTEAIDNWSLGVILYIMLSGSPPFYGKDNREILKAVEKGVFTLSLKPFLSCSIEVKDLISKLLVKNVSRRFTAAQAYNHPWVQQQVDKESKDLIIDTGVLKNLETFLQQKALKKAVMLYVAQMIPEKEVENIRQVFMKMDENGNGVVSKDEFQKGFKLFKDTSKIALDVEDVDHLFAAIDSNHDGVIEYTEFLAVFMDNYIFKNERYLRMAFEKFDLDKSGKISKEELIEVLGGGDLVPLTEIDNIMQQADLNGDGEIDYNEILRYIKMNGASAGKAKEEMIRLETGLGLIK